MKKQNRFQHFSVLLDNLEDKRTELGPEQYLVEKFLKEVKPFRWGANTAAHSIVEFPKEEEILRMNIKEIITLLEKIFASI